MKSIEQICSNLIPRSLYTNISFFSQMMYPKENPDSTRKCAAAVVKLLMHFFGDLSYRIQTSHPDVDKTKLNSYIGQRLGEYHTAMGGWYIASQLLLEGQKYDFMDEIRAQFRKGSIAGYILHTALNKEINLTQAAKQYNKDRLTDFDGKLRNSRKTNIFKIEPENFLKNDWQEVKSVVHYWAALNISTQLGEYFDSIPYINFDKYMSANKELDFIPTGFEGFCTVAHIYLELGRKFIPPKSSFPLIAV